MIWFPESPRYLIETDRDEQAMKILRKLHYDGTNDDWINQEFLEIKTTIMGEEGNHSSWLADHVQSAPMANSTDTCKSSYCSPLQIRTDNLVGHVDASLYAAHWH